MVKNVVIPAITSILTVVFRSLSLKNFSIYALLADVLCLYSILLGRKRTEKSLNLLLEPTSKKISPEVIENELCHR
ncbi:MAG TPA: hypothetical protein PLX25_06715, partial [Sphaerochaeta sp.]|nr:hypothetical protein [Sphaerochaeta sp.]